MNKNLYYVSVIVLILLITFVIWFAYGRKSTSNTDSKSVSTISTNKTQTTKPTPRNTKNPTKNLYPTEQKLQKLKDDLSILIQRSATGEPKRIKMHFNSLIETPNRIIACLSQLPDSTLIYFNMDGKTIQEPVLAMSQKPKLFEELAKSGLLRFLGNVVAIATWCNKSPNKTSPGFEKFASCLDKVNWNDVSNWKNIDKVVEKCLI